MYKKKLLTIAIITILLLTLLCGCTAPPELTVQVDTDSALNDEEIAAAVEMIVEEFTAISAIPRSSGNEQAIADYICQRLLDLGYQPQRDALHNIIVDIPASAEYADSPLTVIHTHLDMFCVAAEGVEYDPLTDAVTLLNDGETLSADNTSLGADNGVGMAMALYLLRAELPHGPLRLIFTSNGEGDMSGAAAISAERLSDVTYVINLDAKSDDTLTIGASAEQTLTATAALNPTAPKKNTAVRISVGGLQGGYATSESSESRLNAVLLLANILADLQSQNILFELAQLQGGSEPNTTPHTASALIVIDAAEELILSHQISQYQEQLPLTYAASEPGITVSYEKVELPSLVMSTSERNNLLNFILLSPEGQQSVSAADGLVNSATLYNVQISATQAGFDRNLRSSHTLLLGQALLRQQRLAEQCLLTAVSSDAIPVWPAAADNQLQLITAEVYADLYGEQMQTLVAYGGSELGFFAAKNSALQMISIGPSISGTHSPLESVTLSSIGKTVQLLQTTLSNI
ncbi:MAG: M20/M25/M40 family metallo-hydrolase [Bacillota bacterium]|nr:M20/M25/M40 family metallo-hydrolase [Bacillota bacterium]